MSRKQPIKETLKVLKQSDRSLNIGRLQLLQRSSEPLLYHTHEYGITEKSYSTRNPVVMQKNNLTSLVVNSDFQNKAISSLGNYLGLSLKRNVHTKSSVKFANKEVLLSTGRTGDKFFLFDPEQRALNLPGLQPSRAMFQTAVKPRRLDTVDRELIENKKKMSCLLDKARVMNLEAERLRRMSLFRNSEPRVFRTVSDSDLGVAQAQLANSSSDNGTYRETLYDFFNRKVNGKRFKRELPPKKTVRPYSAEPRILMAFDKNVKPERGLDLLQKNSRSKETNIIGNMKSISSSSRNYVYIKPPKSPFAPLYKKIKFSMKNVSPKNNNMAIFFSNRYRGKPRFVSLEQTDGSKYKKIGIEKPKILQEKIESSKKYNQITKSKPKKNAKSWISKHKNVIKEKPKKLKIAPPIYKGKSYSLRHNKNSLAKQVRNDVVYDEMPVKRDSRKVRNNVSNSSIRAVTTNEVSSRTAYEPSASHKNAFDRFLTRLHPDSVAPPERPKLEGRSLVQKSVSFTDSYSASRKNSFLQDKPRSPFQKSPERSHGLKKVSLYSKRTDAKDSRPITRSSSLVPKQPARKVSARRFSSLTKSYEADMRAQALDTPPTLDGGRNFLSRLIRWWDKTAN